MTLHRVDWPRVRELFEGALAIPTSERHAYLETACRTSAEIRQQVRHMLESHQAASGFLERVPELPSIDQAVAWLDGVSLGPYKLISPLGAGGMGVVFKALDMRLDRTVAIKLFFARIPGRPCHVNASDQEARVIAALNHPNVCTLFDIGESPPIDAVSREPIRFLVMEYIEGATLDLAEVPVQADRVVEIADQVSEALNAAHAAGVVHRDIKPQNIMLTPAGRVKVLDFGIAQLDRVRAESWWSGFTRSGTETGAMPGTLPYMSPEQLCRGPVTTSSDIFSLGVVLYQLLAGRHPFGADGECAPTEVLAQALCFRPVTRLHSLQAGDSATTRQRDSTDARTRSYPATECR